MTHKAVLILLLRRCKTILVKIETVKMKNRLNLGGFLIGLGDDLVVLLVVVPSLEILGRVNAFSL